MKRAVFLAGIFIGMPRDHGDADSTDAMDRPWRSSIVREPVEGPVRVHEMGIVGDGVADTVNHGGADKAVLAYALTHYAAWREELGRPEMGPGGWGENLVIDGLTEAEVFIGDIWACGDVRLQVSQPRQPCWKLARRWRMVDLAKRTVATGRTGWYLRVLQSGALERGMKVECIRRPCPSYSVARANDIFHASNGDLALKRSLRDVPYLADAWKRALGGISIGADKNDTI